MNLFRLTRVSPVPFEKTIVQAVDITNVSGAFADMGALSLTLSVAKDAFVVFWFDATCRNSSVTVTRAERFQILLDGVVSVYRRAGCMNAGALTPGTIAICGVFGPLTAGNHTVKVQWKNDPGGDSALFCRPVSNPEFEGAQLTMIEVR